MISAIRERTPRTWAGVTAVKREQEAGQTCRRRRRQEGLRPSTGHFRFQQFVNRDDTRADSDQTQDDMKNSQGIQDHGFCSFPINPRQV